MNEIGEIISMGLYNDLIETWYKSAVTGTGPGRWTGRQVPLKTPENLVPNQNKQFGECQHYLMAIF
jgi:hypothetical protein